MPSQKKYSCRWLIFQDLGISYSVFFFQKFILLKAFIIFSLMWDKNFLIIVEKLSLVLGVSFAFESSEILGVWPESPPTYFPWGPSASWILGPWISEVLEDSRTSSISFPELRISFAGSRWTFFPALTWGLFGLSNLVKSHSQTFFGQVVGLEAFILAKIPFWVEFSSFVSLFMEFISGFSGELVLVTDCSLVSPSLSWFTSRALESFSSLPGDEGVWNSSDEEEEREWLGEVAGVDPPARDAFSCGSVSGAGFPCESSTVVLINYIVPLYR